MASVLPLALLSSYPRTGGQVGALAQVVLSLRPHFEGHDEGHEALRPGLAALAILAADGLTAGGQLAASLTASQVEASLEAGRCLIDFVLQQIQKHPCRPLPDLGLQDLLQPLSAFCSGTPALTASEQARLLERLGSWLRPPELTLVPASGQAEAELAYEADSGLPTPDHRPQTDLTALLMGQMTSPRQLEPAQSEPSQPRRPSHPFTAHHVQYMHAGHVGDVLVELCGSLPHLSQSMAMWSEATTGEGVRLPSSQAEAVRWQATFPALAAEMGTAGRALSLPLLEPLTHNRLQRLCHTVMGCLMASVSVATTQSILGLNANLNAGLTVARGGSEAEDADRLAVELVEKSLELFNAVVAMIRQSTRAGGHILQNFTMMGAWILSTGLLVQLANTSQASHDKKSHEARSLVNLVKCQPGFGVLSVALGSQALTLMTSLLQDLVAEVTLDDTNKVEPATFDLFHPFTATQRVALIFKSVPFLSLMFNVATISYRKSCLLQHGLYRSPPGGGRRGPDLRSAKKIKRKSTYSGDLDEIEDDSEDESLYHSSNDDDEDEDSSEPLLGKWIEETMSGPEGSQSMTAKEARDQDDKDVNEKELADSKFNLIVPDRGEPTGFIALATHVFTFLNQHVLTLDCAFVKAYVLSNLSESQLTVLASVIRDLDLESVKVLKLEYHLTALYSEFSAALATFSHNLLACGFLNEHLQKHLLNQLGVSPWNMSSPWPLHVLPRTLAILAQVLLIRQNHEGSGLYSAKHTNLYIVLWEKVLASLTSRIINPPMGGDADPLDDLNVEHAQFLLFLFHALTLMQKKQVLLVTAQNIVKASTVVNTAEVLCTSQMLHLARLVLLLDYLMRNLYEPPKDLMEQVQSNILKRHQSASILGTNPQYFPFKDIESILNILDVDQEEYRKRPVYYNILPTNDHATSGDVPKLDGLACSFLLGTMDMLPYRQIYDSLIRILQILHQPDLRRTGDQEALLATHYCFQLTWRVLQSLPPSVEFLQSLLAPESSTNMPRSTLMHALLLCPRISHKTLGPWIRDSLVKQGVMASEAESLIKQIVSTIHRMSHDVHIFKAFLRDILERAPDDPPGFMDLLFLDVIVAKVHITMDKVLSPSEKTNKNVADKLTSAPETLADAVSGTHELVPIVVQLVADFMAFAKHLMLGPIAHADPSSGSVDALQPMTHSALVRCLSVSGTKCVPTAHFANAVNEFYTHDLRNSLQKWNSASLAAFPLNTTWRTMPTGSDLSPFDPYIHSLIKSHVTTLSQSTRDLNHLRSLKHCLHSIIRLGGDLFLFCADIPKMQRELATALFPILIDSSTESMAELTALALNDYLEKQNHMSGLIYRNVIHQTLEILMNAGQIQTAYLDESILQETVKYLSEILDEPLGRKCLVQFLQDQPEMELVQIMLSIRASHLSPEFTSRVLQLFNGLFELAEKNPTDSQLEKLCSSLAQLSRIPSAQLESWLSRLVGGKSNFSTASKHLDAIHENRILLQSLSKYFVKDRTPIPEEVSVTILKYLLPMAQKLLLPDQNGFGFADLMSVMSTLANADSGAGHVQLFESCLSWIPLVKNRLVENARGEDDIFEDPDANRSVALVNNAAQILAYVSDVVGALILGLEHDLGSSGEARPTSPSEGDFPTENDSDWMEDIQDEDDSGGEDSDDESLCNKLCTFTDTQTQFVQQHWYHCHTCKMIDGIGVCSVCAKVCHANHDVTYSKFGSFFCDCGAKEDESCRALARRNPQSQASTRRREEPRPQLSSARSVPPSTEPLLSSSFRRRGASPAFSRFDADNLTGGKKRDDSKLRERRTLGEKLAPWRDTLIQKFQDSMLVHELLDIVQDLKPVLKIEADKYSTIGHLSRIQKSLDTLHHGKKLMENTDTIMLPTLGSQEGTFENVRMNFTGDQGNSIRQLLTGHMIRRVVMSAISTGLAGKRQHLAVSHEKGKIVILQLSGLLKQSDSSGSQKKLSLTRLSSVAIPFTVLSIVINPVNDEYLAVCGLKDCHILTLNPSGNVSDHLVLHPQLDANNFIIKALWMPGSQTELALVTAEFVKIYKLGRDALSPEYFFLVPCGKIRDATLVFLEDGSQYILIMSSAGHIYYQALTEESLAQNGPFYVTSILEMDVDDHRDSSGNILGGGVSIYYSHSLQLLFFSYAQCKSFVAPLQTVGDEPVQNVFKLSEVKSATKSATPQPLCQWSEVPNHPGLITAFQQSSNIPVILMVRPDILSIQEIKVGSKSKVVDLVTLRHLGANNEPRTTLILLCDDGSLKIFMANEEYTNFWLDNKIHPMTSITLSKPPRKRKMIKIVLRASGPISLFSVDFFESCSLINDVEFGGMDVLQVYNVQQLKHRLNTSGLYIANTKPNGFNLEVTNNDSNKVMVGVRVMIGSQDMAKVASYFEIFGRATHVSPGLNHPRWFDFPLSREESLQADKKLTIFFGSSLDPAGITMVDSVQIYGKTKDAFGWPDDQDEAMGIVPGAGSLVAPGALMHGGADYQDPTLILSPVENLVTGCLNIVDGYFQMCTSTAEKTEHLRDVVKALASQLIAMPTARGIEDLSKSILISLFPNKQQFYQHRDQVLLQDVMQCFFDLSSTFGDVENFHRFILTARGIALARPQNLVKYADTKDLLSSPEGAQGHIQKRHEFINRLVQWFWNLLNSRPANAKATGGLGQSGLTHIESTVQALIEILHAFTCSDLDSVACLAEIFSHFLMAESSQVSFSAKQALIRVLRPKIKRKKALPLPSPPMCSSPPPPPMAQGGPSSRPRPGANEDNLEFHDAVPLFGADPAQALNMGPGGIPLGGIAGNLDALLPQLGVGNIHNVLDAMGGDVDDEAMVELALALSLQEQQHDDGGDQFLEDRLQLQQGLEQLANMGPDFQLQALAGLLGGNLPNMAANDGDEDDMEQEEEEDEDDDDEQELPSAARNEGHVAPIADGAQRAIPRDHYSDGGSEDDDEGSTGAMEGNALRTPPQDHEGGSESGASAIESIGGESGQASARFGSDQSSSNQGDRGTRDERRAREEASGSSATILEEDLEWERNNARLHSLRLMILDHLLTYVPKLGDIGGVRSIPFMQVILMLTTDLDATEDRDREVLDKLLLTLIEELKIINENERTQAGVRSTPRELQLVIMRLFSVLMSRSKSWQGPNYSSATISKSSGTGALNIVAQGTAGALVSAGLVQASLEMLKHLLEFWTARSVVEDNSMKVGSSLLKTQSLSSPPDMSPFFLKQYVKGHAHDVFEAYPQLLTEMALRLPYQIKKIQDAQPKIKLLVFHEEWFHTLCQYMMTQQTPFVRRQVRKLLLYICGTKEKYRELRDVHSLDSHMKAIQAIISVDLAREASKKDVKSVVNFSYDTLLQLIEHFKACVDISMARTQNWQRFCLQHDWVLKFLFQVSFILDDGVNPIVLQLLQNALCVPKSAPMDPGVTPPPNLQPAPQRRLARSALSRVREEKSRSEEPDEIAIESKPDARMADTLVFAVNKTLERDLLFKFVEKFLLECNSTSVRWQAHSLIVTLQSTSLASFQDDLVDIFWELWHQSPAHGHKAAQFVDLLGYFSMKLLTDEHRVTSYVEEAVNILKAQNQILANHPNSNVYNSLSKLVDFSGYFLESDPCLVCNNPDVPYTSLKLSSLKVDTKYTTTTHIVKLSSSLSISKIALRIGDLKRQKMVRTINIYYNNRSVQAVVELKNKQTVVWNKAKKVSLNAGQTDIKIDFPLPIVACNLMIEYADFYENIQACSETLQCPRCSASVPANPGVCSNCGENVFQCHKCRSINYDEKDPFLCNTCGFCKYAKFEYTLTSRPCCAVDPIESEEDRKKAVSSINHQLDKADKTYKQLIASKPHLESLLLKISESGGLDEQQLASLATTLGPTTANGSYVNVYIQQLAQKYCGDSKSLFEELSKTTQRVMATRKELLAYDNSRRGMKIRDISSRANCNLAVSSGKCYGCAAASVEHCLTLLRALANRPQIRHLLYEQGLIEQLLEYNLRRGTMSLQAEVRKLITHLTKDNLEATKHLNSLLLEKLSLVLRGHRGAYPDLVEAMRHEMALLSYTVQKEDQCWEERLRCVIKIFLLATDQEVASPIIMDCITFPCLKILQGMVRPAIKFRRGKENKLNDPTCHVEGYASVAIDVQKWLDHDSEHRFEHWEKSSARPKLMGSGQKRESGSKKEDEDTHPLFLRQKYFRRWFEKTFRRQSTPLEILPNSWLKTVLFNPTSRSARQMACNMVDSFCNVHERKQDIIDLLTTYLDELGDAGEFGGDFVALYQRLITTDQWKLYLATRGTLTKIADLMMREIEKLNRQEETTLSTDLAQGFALKTFSDLLGSFVAVDRIKGAFKSRLISTVLHGYLLLRRLVVQRTKLIDQTQDRLLELLEDMTSGTLDETKSFMAVCVETIRKYPKADQLTPIFIFERLCNIIFPEETDTGEFFMTLEKDPQQEDFLQGRMVGNPYNSNHSDMGPLMREIKNKICRDCELVALLEDDNGMELLVNNKIISLDLPVKDVYQKVWLPNVQEGEPMRIIYRMRGLLGDATEEFIEDLENKDREDQDEEDVYKLANVMAECQGLEVILERLESVQDAQYSKQLLAVLLKLLGHCIKVRQNRDKLLRPSLKTIPILLGSLDLCLSSGETTASPASGPSLSEHLLDIMERLLVEAAANEASSIEDYVKFASNGVEPKTIERLLEQAIRLKSGTNLHHGLMRVLPFLAYGHADKMSLIVHHFSDIMDLDSFDGQHSPEDEAKMEAFVAMCEGIERNNIGNTLKDCMIALDILGKFVAYINTHAPPPSAMMAKTENAPLWKDLVSKPSLKFVLRAMAGLALEHEPSQILIANNSIPGLHQMEQVSSDEHVGSLAEAVLEALSGCPPAQAKVAQARDETKAEKKKLAMAMRAKQLKAIGLKTNEMGQVKADSNLLKQFGLAEESGLSCNICREGYKFHPNKVLAIYTFTLPCPVEEFEYAPRKTMGYSTVTHFNLVHVDCHTAAVRQVRSRDEWESALLQNANTKCNGLLPLWGPSVAESAFAACLARHNTYLAEAAHSQRDIGYQSTNQDLKLLLLRFAEDRSFSEESGGGGPQSNMHIVPYLIHMGLYVLNTTRGVAREEKHLNAFLDLPKEKWFENAYVAEGPLYYTTLCLMIVSPKRWSAIRIKILQRLLLTAHIRSIHPRPPKTLADRTIKDYSVYKKIILFFALVDQLFTGMFQSISVPVKESDWPVQLADWIRKNDDGLLKASTKVLSTFQDDLMPACSVDEIVDVCGLLEEIPSPASFLLEILANVP